MDFDEDLISHTLEHKGCGIRAASYEVRPRSWLPEACVWLQTEYGYRKLWIHSFAHCFAAEDLTFPNQLDADSWALLAAKSIIDHALEHLNPAALSEAKRRRPFSRAWSAARYTMFNLAHLPRLRRR
ncbi:MAG TPA: hypothetical protein VMT22_04085 [Terriglobales bacterium]|jgi:hypothetical protein|nr:hypothetical protein [Terriglobales bacterium]